jgi:GNAT superfamily N-acetyltransferase
MASVRRAESRDEASILELAQALAASFSVEPEAFRENFSLLLASPSALLSVAEEDDLIIGYVLAFEHRTFYANGPVAWAEELMVRPENRRRGVGKLLMRSAEEWARSKGCKLIALATRRAADFYEAAGYEESALYFRKLL